MVCREIASKRRCTNRAVARPPNGTPTARSQKASSWHNQEGLLLQTQGSLSRSDFRVPTSLDGLLSGESVAARFADHCGTKDRSGS